MASFSKSRFAAYLQDIVSKRREEVGLYSEIAEALQLPSTGRVLDVGTGSGLQLKVVNGIRPAFGLYGIDVSEAATRVAERNLKGLEVDLRTESIESTTHEDDFFDVVTCNASMSYWKNPIQCFNEIFRILKPGGVARLFEPQKDVDLDEVGRIIEFNLADKSRLRRFIAVRMNKFGLRWGGRLGLKLHSIDELMEIARQSTFGESVSIERITLQNLPIFVQIILVKQIRL
jgi:ubiquinone/menaquinone biosynthesis C-methylase UbiE